MLGSRTSRLVFWIAGFLAILANGAAQVAPPDPASTRGTVVNSVTHDPIGHAQVYSPDNRFATMTDDQGHFDFVSPGPVGTGTVLVARKPGFLDERDGQNVESDSDPRELTIRLIPEAILMGRVTVSGSDSSDGVQVQLFHREIRDGLAHWVPQNTVNTNSRGEYRFAELYPGDYRVGTHEIPDNDPTDLIPGGKILGYPPEYFPSASDFSSATTIHLSPGKVVQADFTPARRRYYPVKISVPNGASFGTTIGTNVSVGGDGAPGYSLSYHFGDQTIRGFLPDGTYAVEAFTFLQPGASGMINLRVAGGPAEAGQVTILPNGSIPVRVKEEFSTPSPEENLPPGVEVNRGRSDRHRYVNVSLESYSDFGQRRGAYLRAPTGPNDDALVVDNVEPGRYWVRVTSGRGYVASVTAGGIDLLHEALVVGAGGSSPPIEVTVRDGTASFDGEIEGGKSAMNPANNSMGQTSSPMSFGPFAFVYCLPMSDSSGQFTEIFVQPGGKINSPGMAPGDYLILAFKRQRQDLEYRNPEAMRAYESKGQVIRLVSGQREHLKLQLVSDVGKDAE